MMRWPGHIEPGTTSQQVTTAQDLYPTIASATGIALEANQKLDGKSVWNALRNNHELVNGPFIVAGSDIAIFDGDWKLIQNQDGRLSLFNLRTDPRESINVWDQNVETGECLKKQLLEAASKFPSLAQRRGPPPGNPGPRRPNPR